MEKQIRFIRIFLFVFGLIFFTVGAVIGFGPFAAEYPTVDHSQISYIFMGIGFLEMLVVVVWTLVLKNRGKKKKWLMENGQTLRASFVAIRQNKSFEVNGRNPYYILCEWKDTLTGEVHEFKSDNIWYDPSPHTDTNRTITVYYDPSNFKKYWIDTSFLPK